MVRKWLKMYKEKGAGVGGLYKKGGGSSGKRVGRERGRKLVIRAS